jgi:hypothetical protein
VLLSSGALFSVNLLVEAPRVEDGDHSVPVPALRERFQRGIAATGAGQTLGTPRLPGRDGSFVISRWPCPPGGRAGTMIA